MVRIEVNCEENQTREVKIVTGDESCETEKEGRQWVLTEGDTKSLQDLSVEEESFLSCLCYKE